MHITFLGAAREITGSCTLVETLIRLVREGRLPDIDIVVDSPLATKATQVTLKHWRLLDPDVAPTFESAMRKNGRPRIRFTESVEESAAAIERELGWRCELPAAGATMEL